MKIEDIIILVTEDPFNGNSLFREIAFWIKKIKSYEGYRDFGGSLMCHFYIDTKKIDYEQIKSLWIFFSVFEIKYREQLEVFLPYLSKEELLDFEYNYIGTGSIMKKRKAIPVEVTKKNDIVTISFNKSQFWHVDETETFHFGLTETEAYIEDKNWKDSSTFNISIDATKINFVDLAHLWKLFEVFKVKCKEQLEVFLPYLKKRDELDTGDSEKDFKLYYLIPRQEELEAQKKRLEARKESRKLKKKDQ